MAYEVIKRVSGRAYRYRVESFRDPETRRVRGRWTYLGRVDPEEAGLPAKPPRPSSRERLLDAVVRLLGEREAEALSAGAIAREAGVAYGTFYRYFTDRAHAVREALLRRGAAFGDHAERFSAALGSREDERARLVGWTRTVVEAAIADKGVVRAWNVYSNADDAVAASRTEAVDAANASLAGWLRRLREAHISDASVDPDFAAYGVTALVLTLARDCALNPESAAERVDGIVTLCEELCGVA